MDFVPKIKVEVIVKDSDVDTSKEATIAILKIFVTVGGGRSSKSGPVSGAARLCRSIGES